VDRDNVHAFFWLWIKSISIYRRYHGKGVIALTGVNKHQYGRMQKKGASAPFLLPEISFAADIRQAYG
jgi:hypothetical protein